MRFKIEVLCSGGWKFLAQFENETDAWEYAMKHLDWRFYDEGRHLYSGDGRKIRKEES